ncbi:MAG TPA: chromate transporter [Polyangiaceae bacterium]|nr:chromate transporter [Polyangiaceae bacterium]
MSAARVSSAAAEGAIARELVPYSQRELVLYFLRLGALGFGGPIALAGYMQRDLVEHRRWIAKQDYVEGLALAQLSPGPLAAQLAMYLGWVRGGALGAAAVGAAFVLPSFVVVVALAWPYLHYGGLPWMQGIFYGVGAAVTAIIVRSATKLAKLTLGRDTLLWVLFGVSGVVTAATGSEIVWLVLACGVVTMFVRAPPRASGAALFMLPAAIMTGAHGVTSTRDLGQIAWFFTKAGAFVFGSGLAIVPFLYDGAVREYQWLTEQQFRDAVAVAMITPGPVVITAAFIGYLAAGVAGALVAAAGTFVPPYLVVVVAARWLRKPNPRVKAFVTGVTASATGAIAGAALILGRRAIVDVPTVAIAAVMFLLAMKFKKIPEPALIVVAGLVGMAFKMHG